ncbi:methyltransferase domain-containing protein [Flavobacteriaceae bacterium TP-CH-4]|uniref:Methyltransferase domain-containing protein n=1 Tax=Pelagihabitans pacificus TaxID=2696054 RepID=A0A967E6V4_9FLAO|nr:methyltransferase domain-containing protein [Pelagihabitans pacificus]NHF60015.1 methyltransferase domain-containing protein [Pelagihabitans pacificus]
MLAKLEARSTEPELMDNFKGSIESLEEVLQDINKVNRILGGNQITISAVARLMKQHPRDSYTIMDVGCADGTMLRAIARYCRKKDIKADFVGIDLNGDALVLAEAASSDFPEIRYLKQDVLELEKLDLNCDILVTTLMTHHFTNTQLEILLAQFARLADMAVVNNDLHRSRLAFYLFKAFSAVFIKTETARIDGLISIRKGFKKRDLVALSKKLPQMLHHIQWKWAFRYVWIMQPKRPNTL